MCTFVIAGDGNKKKLKRKEKKRKTKRVANNKSDSSSESDGGPLPSVDPEVIDSYFTCDGTFKFYKVGKASPSLEFTTILRLKREISLSDLRKDLIQQHMIGIELFKKLPAYEVYIHVKKKDKTYTAHTTQQWTEIRDLLTRGYSLSSK